MKDVIYKSKIRQITDLKRRIYDAIATISEAKVERARQEIEYRLNVLRSPAGVLNEVKSTSIKAD